MTNSQTTEQRNAEVVSLITQLMPFELACGDTMQRTNPSAKQLVNSSVCWLVSNQHKSHRKLREIQGKLSLLLEEVSHE